MALTTSAEWSVAGVTAAGAALGAGVIAQSCGTPWLFWALVILTCICAVLSLWFFCRSVEALPRVRVLLARVSQRRSTTDVIEVVRAENLKLHHAYGLLRASPAQPTWSEFSVQLSAYWRAVQALGKRAHSFHARLYDLLKKATDSMDVPALRSPMDQLTDILFAGELDLEVTTASLEAIPFFASGRRRRFAIARLCLTNHSGATMNLLPNWCMEPAPGETIYFDPDGESLPEWEALRRNHPGPASPPLPVPLRLLTEDSAIGYWAFCIDGLKRFVGGAIDHGGVSSYLEISDLLTGRRTKTDSVQFEMGVFREAARRMIDAWAKFGQQYS